MTPLIVNMYITYFHFYKCLIENHFPYFRTLLGDFFQLILVSALCFISSNACNQLVVIITYPDIVNSMELAQKITVTSGLRREKIYRPGRYDNPNLFTCIVKTAALVILNKVMQSII